MARNKYPEETIQLILEKAREQFVENGYEDTSIQDIIDQLGGLSKGAIYHHFKSKEEIFEAVTKQLAQENMAYFEAIRDNPTKTGREKLQMMIASSYQNPNNDIVISVATKILSDPRFFMSLLQENYDLVVPSYLQPVIQQGVKDGTIVTDYPKELSEVIMTLLNIWINPIIHQTTLSELKKRLRFFEHIMERIGVPLLDDVMIENIINYFRGIVQ